MEKEEACLSTGSLNIPFQKAKWPLVSHAELKGHRTPASGASCLTLTVQEPHTRTITECELTKRPFKFPCKSHVRHQRVPKIVFLSKNICPTFQSLMLKCQQ